MNIGILFRAYNILEGARQMNRHTFNIEMNMCMCWMLFSQVDDMTRCMAHLSYIRN